MHTTRRTFLALSLGLAGLPMLSCNGDGGNDRCVATTQSVNLTVVQQRWNDRSPVAEQLGEFIPAGEGEAAGFALSTAEDGLAGLAVSATTVVVEDIPCSVELRLTVPNATDVTHIPNEDELLARFVYAVSGTDEESIEPDTCYGEWDFEREQTPAGAGTTFHASACDV